MTEKVINMFVRKYELFAKRFVDTYIAEGPISAGRLARYLLSKEERIESQDFVREEFEERGYSFFNDSTTRNPPKPTS